MRWIATVLHLPFRTDNSNVYSKFKFENIGTLSTLYKYLKLRFILLHNFLLSLTVLHELQA